MLGLPADRLPPRAGIGLKPRHFRAVVGGAPDVGGFEVYADNGRVDRDPYQRLPGLAAGRLPSPPRGVDLRSPVLADCCGDRFSGFVAGFVPMRSVPCLAGVARVGLTRVRSFHAACAVRPSAEALAHAVDCGDRVGELRIGLLHAVDAIDSRHTVVSIRAAHQAGSALDSIDPDRPESAHVLRDGLVVGMLPVGRGETTFVRRVLRGTPIADAAFDAIGADAAFDLGQALSTPVAEGAVTTIVRPAQRP